MSNPAELLAFAETHKLGTGAARRAAISRAYYAAFHALQDAVLPLIDDADIGRNGCAKHGAVLRALRTWQSKHPDRKLRMSFGADALKAYNKLEVCLDEREKADYLMGPAGELSPQEVVAIVGKARRVIEFADKF